MNVTKLRVIDIVNGRDLAYLYPGEASWRDPFGGAFSEEEERQLTTVAEGDFREVVLGAGTKFERLVQVRFAVSFK